MKAARPDHPMTRFAKTSLVLELLLSIGALAGGLVLILAPRGEIMPLPLSALAGSPFDTYFGPGLILFTVLGLGPLIAVGLTWQRHPLAPMAALAVGAALLIWVAVEIAIIGYSSEPPLQAIYLTWGLPPRPSPSGGWPRSGRQRSIADPRRKSDTPPAVVTRSRHGLITRHRGMKEAHVRKIALVLVAPLAIGTVLFGAARMWRHDRRVGTAFVNSVRDSVLLRRGLAGSGRSEIATLEHVGRRSGMKRLTPVHPEATQKGFRIVVPLGMQSERALT